MGSTARSLLLCLVCASAACGNDDDDVSATTRELLVAITATGGEEAWRLDYDESCRLESLSIRADPPAAFAPEAYNNPLGFSGPGRRLDFAYGTGGKLASISLIDTLLGRVRERVYAVEWDGARITALTPQAEFYDGQVIQAEGVGLRYAYDGDGRVDSVLYSDGNSVGYSFDAAGNLTQADYRAFAEGRATTEFYAYSDAPTNPLAALPIHYVMTYAPYRAPRLPSNATFDLRAYSYVSDRGQVLRQTELTFGDSSAVSTYVYELRVCE